MKKARKRKSIIPGFGLSFGVTMTILSLVVLIPLCSLVVFTARLSPSEFWYTITRPRILSGYWVSLSTAFTAALVNAVMGLILAWVLVRYDFPGKRFLDGIIELPFALPTAVAGISLTHLTTTNGWVGKLFFERFGLRIAYTRLGITIALIFIGIPFVVRSVQPVLEKIDIQYEEAALILGADRRTTFWKVIFPEILPALISGFTLAFARSIGINDGLMRQYRRGCTYISDAQLSRIEQGIHTRGAYCRSCRDDGYAWCCDYEPEVNGSDCET